MHGIVKAAVDMGNRWLALGAWGLAWALFATTLGCPAGRVDGCTDDFACDGKLCIEGRCEPGSGDLDRDGLSNAIERLIGSNPANPDTDGDGFVDDEEVGFDPSHPLDTDGDKVPDVLESAVRDADRDCMSEQFDVDDQRPDAPGPWMARYLCASQGVCAASQDRIVVTCDAGAAACDYSGIPDYADPEGRCDGLDNDCDGKTDEGFGLLGVPVGFGCIAPGACGKGTVECAPDGFGTRCSTAPGGSQDHSRDELCDGLDNDCDGVTDDVVYQGQPLGGWCMGRGMCGMGMVECLGPEVVCSTDPGGSADRSVAEVCDGLDNDCDGDTDEDLILPLAPSDVCKLLGLCAVDPSAVLVMCENAEPRCSFELVPGYSGNEEESCDGIDEDCDGLIDDAFTYADLALGPRTIGESCGVGACALGVVRCASSREGATCSTLSLSAPESCNGADDDCDGRIDNGVAKVFGPSFRQDGFGEPGARAGAAMVHVPSQDSIYVLGGASQLAAGDAALSVREDFWRYDLKEHRFVAVAPAPPGRYVGAVLMHDPVRDRILLTGGAQDPDRPDSLWAYGIASGTWTDLAISFPLHGSVAAGIDPEQGRAYAVRLDAPVRKLVRLRLSDSGRTEVVTTLPFRVGAASAFVAASGILVIAGGADESGALSSDIFLLDVNTGVVQTLAVPDASNLPLARMRHGMALQSDGSLLIAGGVGSAGEVLSSPLRVHLNPLLITPVTAVSLRAVAMPAMAVVGDTTMLYSGRTADGSALRQMLRCDLTAHCVRDDLDLVPSPRAGSFLAVSATRRAAYLLGGIQDDLMAMRPAPDMWSLSLVTGKFKKLAFGALLPPRVGSAHAVDVTGRYVYVHGGADGLSPDGEWSNRFVRLDTETGAVIDVESTGPAPSPRMDHSLVTMPDGRMVLYGGRSNNVVLGDLWRFDPGQGWTRIITEDHPRYGHVAFAEDDASMIVAGGLPLGTVSRFDPDTGVWLDLVAHDTLHGIGGKAFYDPQSSQLLFLPAVGNQGFLVTLKDGGIMSQEFAVASVPATTNSAFAFDPFGRQGLVFGGIGSDQAMTSARWSLPQLCP